MSRFTMCAAAAWAAVLASCDAGPYRCATNAQCVDQQDHAGICEPDGYCSLADSTCAATARRYIDDDGAPKAGSCVAAAATGCVSELAGGDRHLCLIRDDGAVWCWGGNEAGQLGDGTTEDRARPVRARTPPGVKFTEVTAGENQTCALAADHTVWCWGSNDSGQLGIVNAAGALAAGSPVPVQVMLVSGSAPALAFQPLYASQVSTGGKHVCVVDRETAVLCWGENDRGQCGQDLSAGDDVLVPTAVAGLEEGYVGVALSETTSACVKDDGSVFELGSNASGQLGVGSKADAASPVRAQIGSVKRASAGAEHVCAAKNDGSIWCWGYGASVGLAAGDDQTVPQRILTADSVWTGGSAFQSCAVQDTALLCWGQSTEGQVGDGRLDPENATVFTPTPALIATVTRAAASRGATCATTVDHQLWCWGANDHGQLARGMVGEPDPVPTRVDVDCN